METKMIRMSDHCKTGRGVALGSHIQVEGTTFQCPFCAWLCHSYRFTNPAIWRSKVRAHMRDFHGAEVDMGPAPAAPGSSS